MEVANQDNNQERTLGLIKPDATKRNIIGGILKIIEGSGLKIVKLKKLKLDRKKAELFYQVHRERPFFESLIDFMTSDDIVAFVAEGPSAVSKYREVIGSTDPGEAIDGTVRKTYGIDKEKNSVHGSDSVENAKLEIDFFFRTN